MTQNAPAGGGVAGKLGIAAGLVVQELGRGPDCDDEVTAAVAAVAELVDADFDDVEPSDIADAAPTAGLQSTSTISAAVDWQGTRLVAPRSRH